MFKLLLNKIYVFAILSVICVSCNFVGKQTKPIEQVHKTAICTNDSMHSYELYIPQVESKCSNLPLVVIIDPHAQGETAIEYFTDAAETYQCALVASNLVRNNDPNYLKSISILIDDVKEKYAVGDEIYLAGFSGGARMVLSYAEHYSASGLLVSGALASASQLRAIEAPVMVIQGMADFNFIEAAQYIFKPAAAPSNLFIEFTYGKHAWPNSNQISSALAYLRLMNTSKDNCRNNSHVVKQYCDSEKQRIANFRNKKQPLIAGLVARNMSHIAHFNEFHDFVSIRNSLEFSAPFIAELDLLKESIRMELQVRKAYASAIQEESITFWKPELDALNQNIAESSDVFQKMALQRVKAFIGILCYSVCNRGLLTNDIKTLQNIIPIYEYAEPQNADMFFFKAILAQIAGDKEGVVKALKQSLQLGFTDSDKIRSRFPQSILDLIVDLN